MANILAAIGLAQMEQLATFLEKKKLIDQIYRENIEKIAILQAVEPQVSPNFWLFTAIFENSEQIATQLNRQGVQVRKLWYPLNRLPMNRDCLYIQQEDITWQVYEKSLSLPSGVGLQAEDVLRVCEVIKHLGNNQSNTSSQ